MADDESRPKTIFIDENVEIHEGEQARQRLQVRAEAENIDTERGVTQVTEARWQEAQRYERRTWLEKGRRATSDRNEEHRQQFAGYAPLRGLHFKHAIELGCGPFTNIRLILEQCTAEQVTLLDPLLTDYLAHPFCRYRYGRLGGLFNEHLGRLPAYLRRPGRFARGKANDYRIGGFWGRPVTLAPAMIERFETQHRFDLVVMINVLEHCQDAAAVFHKIDEILLPGGVFVYHDKMYRAEQVQRLGALIYDAGHPLRVDQSVVNAFLGRHFAPLMQAQYLVQSDFRGVSFSYYDFYFIGRKETVER
jgi:SAM-dependent methyltransferase